MHQLYIYADGLRKGSAIYADSGTMMPSSMPGATGHRGDWSMGAVFDAYFKFLPTGDHHVCLLEVQPDPILECL